MAGPRNRAADAGWMAAIVLALGAVYAVTAARTVTLEDSGVLLVTAWSAGVAHPPGYPLWVMLASAFARLPGLDVALGVHLFCGAAGAAACCALFACARRMGAMPAVAAMAALAYGLSDTFWVHATGAEVYTLAAFLWLAVLALLLGVNLGLEARRRAGQPGAGPAELRGLRFAALAYGLALSNHWPITILASLPFVVVMAPHVRVVARRAPGLLAWLGLGLVPYLWLPLRSAAGALTTFGPVENLGDLLWYVGRRGYRAMETAQQATAIDTYAFLNLFFDRLTQEMGWPVFLAAVGGVFALWLARERRAFWTLALSLISTSVLFRLLAPGEVSPLGVEQFLAIQVVPYAALALFAAHGVQAVARRERVGPLPGRGLATVLALALTASVALLHAGDHDRRGERLAHDYARLVLNALPPDAVLVVESTVDLGPIAFAHQVEGRRPDVRIVSQSAALLPDRLFDPMHADWNDAVTAFERLLGEEPVVWATFPGRLLLEAGARRGAPRSSGLLERISLEPGSAALAEPVLDEIETVLTRELDPPSRVLFASQRGRILGRLCRALALRDRAHPMLDAHPRCRLASGLVASHRGEHAEALRNLATLPDDVAQHELPALTWAVLFERRLHARLQVDPALARDPARLREAVVTAWPGVVRYARCDNPVAARIVRIAEQPGVAVEALALDRLVARFDGCPALGPRLRALAAQSPR